MPNAIYVIVEGTKQGVFKGENPRGDQKTAILALGFRYEVQTPRDPATGQPTGKRQHQPIVITKRLGPATPQLFAAMFSNEVLKSVVIEFARTNATGTEELDNIVTLTNATIVNIRQFTDRSLTPDPQQLDEFSLSFQTIKIENKSGQTMGLDDLSRR